MTRRALCKPLELKEFAGPGPRRRWRRRLLVAVLLLVGLIAATPTLVCVTPLWRVIAGRYLPPDLGKLEVAKLSLGWFTPIDVHGISVREPTGEKLLEAERLQISRSLVDLILAGRNLGTIRVDRPQLYAKVQSNGSNLEDFATKLAQVLEEQFPSDESKEKRPTRYLLEVIDGTVETADVAAGNQWVARGLNLTLDRTATDAALKLSATGHIGPPPVEGAAPVVSGPERPESFAVTIEPIDAQQQQLRVRTSDLPLAALEPWCRRFDAQLQLSGWLTGDGSATWTVPTAAEHPPADAPQHSLLQQLRAAQWSTSGRFVAEDVAIAVAALSGDRLTLASVEIPWRLDSRDGYLQIDELQVRTPVGTARLRGALAPDELPSFTLAEFLRLKNLELQTDVDLAGAAALLTQTLQIRPDTTITAGHASLTLRNQLVEDRHTLTGSLQAANLAATRGGSPIRWDQPIHASFALEDSAAGFELQSLRCESDFLQLDASGNAGRLRGTLTFNLDRLAEQLGQFVDVAGWTIAGAGSTDFEWGASAPGQFTAKVTGDLTQVLVSHEGRDLFREPKLRLEGTAIGDRTAERAWPTRLASGEFSLRTDSDELHASLTAPVDLTAADRSCPIHAKITGNVANWLLRLQPWIDSSQWTVEGTTDSQLTADVGPAGARVSKCDVKLTNLRAASPEWLVVEPRVEISGSGSWHLASGLIEVPDAQLISSTVAGRVAELRWPASGGAPGEASGTVALRADLARLSAWRTQAASPSTWSLAGRVVGNARIHRTGSQVAADLDLTGDNLQLRDLAPPTGAAPRTVWQEPKVTLVGHAAYDPSTDRVTLDNLQVTSDTLRLAMTGSIEEFSSVGRTQLVSTVDYDLAQITPLVAPFVGRGVALAGRHQGRLELRGQLADPSPATSRHWSQRWQGRFEFPWSSVSLYGLPIGPGKLAGVLIEGVATFTPLDLGVGDGRLQASPLVRLDPPPSLATLNPGQVLTDVRITPEVSDTLLKYISPVLADTTRSEGLFSLRLDQTQMPLGDPTRADVAGELHIQSARVQPGPMVNQWVNLAREVESLARNGDPSGVLNRTPTTLVSITDRRVKFRLVDGRVHTEGNEYQVGDVTIRSRGSVGLDETLQLMLEIPLQDRWLEGRPLLVGLRGQSLQIPVVGTFKRPQLDRGALAGLSRQLLQGAAQQAIGNELNRALEGLFKPRQPPQQP